MTREDYFWKRVDTSGGPDACWPWTMSCQPSGYGQFNMGGRIETTHRLAYRFAHGAIPVGKLIMHSCDNRPCCNPKHLQLGTDAENAADMKRKNRQARGERHSQAKLTTEVVRLLRAESAAGKRPRALAESFNLTPRHVRQILNREIWGHVAD